LRFTLANAYKDLGYYTQMARDSDSAHDIADSVAATYERLAAVMPGRYASELATLLNEV
jgi:3-hydroxyisobutyrate dehydrogenase-like beta-hydroxyacid dehydrogenase